MLAFIKVVKSCFFKSKGFIVTSLTVVCVTILGVCWFAGQDKNEPFMPDDSPPASAESTWSENNSQTDSSNGADAYVPPQSTTRVEEYPKVVEESKNKVVIDFTNTEPSATEATPPPAPEGKIIKEDPGPAHEVNRNPEVTAPSTGAPADTEPASGSGNGNGAVYDPVFGWVVPGEVSQSTIDSDGDPNKMVGNMGD